VLVNGRRWSVRNTNRLVGAPGWHVLLSKTGFTNEAGRVLGMRVEVTGRTVTIVLMGAAAPSLRTRDAIAIRRWLAGDTAPAATPVRRARVRAAYQPLPRPWPALGSTTQTVAPVVVPSGQTMPADQAAGGVEPDAEGR
jgi:D-alanyl-D-alanine carboxypeptidase